MVVLLQATWIKPLNVIGVLYFLIITLHYAF